MLSDFYQQKPFTKELQICNRKHDVVAIQVYDRRDAALPNIGLMRVRDAETGHEQYLDTSSKKVRNAYSEQWKKRQDRLHETFTHSGVDSVAISTNDDYVKYLMMLFKKRK